jgi:PKD repeat protein
LAISARTITLSTTPSGDNTKPTANAGSDQTANAGTPVTFDASASTDNVGIVSYEWNFGDGTTGTGKTTTHTYTNTGPYTVTLTVEDAADNTATKQIIVTVISAEGLNPMWMIGAAIAVIGIAIATVLLLRKRK